jgi:hypothetical protein
MAAPSRKWEGIQQNCQADSDWRLQSKQSSFPSACKKWVTGHCGGVGPLRNERGDITSTARWKSIAVRNGILERHWKSADRQSKIAQIIHSWSRVNNILTELHRGPSGGHLDVSKTLDKVWQRCCCLQAGNDIENWCQQCDTCAAGCGCRTSNQPNASVWHWGPFRKDNNQCSRAFPMKWPRKPIPSDRNGLLNQVAGSLCYSKLRGLDNGGSAGYQLLLPFQSTSRAT